MIGVATKLTPFKLVLAFDFHISYDHSQHLFMNVDSRYLVRHNFPPGRSGERAASSLSRVTGYRRSHSRGETTPNYSLNHARSGSDTRTASTSPLRNRSRRSEASPILHWTLSYFHEISRAAGPNRHAGKPGHRDGVK